MEMKLSLWSERRHILPIALSWCLLLRYFVEDTGLFNTRLPKCLKKQAYSYLVTNFMEQMLS
jgi:hypothetical protein